MGSLRSSAQAHELGHLATEPLAANRNQSSSRARLSITDGTHARNFLKGPCHRTRRLFDGRVSLSRPDASSFFADAYYDDLKDAAVEDYRWPRLVTGPGSLSLSSLDPQLRAAVLGLQSGYRIVFEESLAALYVYGAITFPETEAVVDLDYHAFLTEPPDAGRLAALQGCTEQLAHNHAPWGADLDGWLLLLRDAGMEAPPEHVLHPGVCDRSWALHRAHWLAGRCFVLHGPAPAELVRPPDWSALVAGLEHELDFATQSPTDAFAVLNACRILHSFTTRDVVHSKFGSAHWGLAYLPVEQRPAIAAAMATYRGDAKPADAERLVAGRETFLGYVRAAVHDILADRTNPWGSTDGDRVSVCDC